MLRVVLRVVLACVSCMGDGRRIRISAEHFQSKSTPEVQLPVKVWELFAEVKGTGNPLKRLARFLLEFNPTQGWGPALTTLQPARCTSGTALRAAISRACAPSRRVTHIDYTKEGAIPDDDSEDDDMESLDYLLKDDFKEAKTDLSQLEKDMAAYAVDEEASSYADRLGDSDELLVSDEEDQKLWDEDESDQDFPEWQPEGFLKFLVKAKEAEVKTWESLPENREDGPWYLRLRYPSMDTCFRLGRAIGNRPEKPVVFADLKRSSPADEPGRSETLKEDMNIIDEVDKFMDLGCAGVFVAADYNAYRGSYSDLKSATNYVRMLGPEDADPNDERIYPIIAKDLVVHPLQIARAACSGAKAVLLIAGLCLPDLEDLIDTCVLMGLESVVEVHTRLELAVATEAIAGTILVNERNRATGEIVPGKALELAPYLPPVSQYLVCGNISTIEQVRELRRAGYDGFVIGRALLRDPDKGKALLQEILEEPIQQRVTELIRCQKPEDWDERQDWEEQQSEDDEQQASDDDEQQASNKDQQPASDTGNEQESKDATVQRASNKPELL